MARLHTRVKRKLGLTSSFKHRFRNVKGKNGPKTFKTEEQATEYAKKLGLSDYSVVSAKKGKKFKVIGGVAADDNKASNSMSSVSRTKEKTKSGVKPEVNSETKSEVKPEIISETVVENSIGSNNADDSDDS